jgi:sugar (pentulose or hexulose) kinase
MPDLRHVAVIDIGKTTAKVAIVDLAGRVEIDMRTRPNRVLRDGPYPHYDTDALWAFILDGLRDLNGAHGIDAITVTTHGASAALLDSQGELVAPILDYEHDGPDTLATMYDGVRPGFAETGSPRLPLGLNLGAQLFWQFETFRHVRQHTRTILTYPQYWAYRICGIAANEVTSLGCHTDLWNPARKRFSSLVEKAGWAGRMAPIAAATDLLGPVLPEICDAIAIARATPVYCGIHDSNASLYAHLAARTPPFAVVSTGTWVITMAIGGTASSLDPSRDMLINVNASGDPVPSARFMGGREFERLMGERAKQYQLSDVRSVVARKAMLLPAVELQSGPFQGRMHVWTVDAKSLSDAEYFVAVSFYLALMTATGLELTGARGPVLVEGPFSGNIVYLEMLAAAAGRTVNAVAGTGTSTGAAQLIGRQVGGNSDRTIAHGNRELAGYAAKWFALTG